MNEKEALKSLVIMQERYGSCSLLRGRTEIIRRLGYEGKTHHIACVSECVSVRVIVSSTVVKSQGPGDQARRHKFQPMANHERRMVHELAPHYGCDSLSYDSEPLRHVTVSTKK